MWQGAHPANEVGPRNNNELGIVAQALDTLLRGELPELGDLLTQRLKALKVACTKGCRLGEQLELQDKRDLSLAGSEEMREAVRSRFRVQKLEDGLGKAKGGGS